MLFCILTFNLFRHSYRHNVKSSLSKYSNKSSTISFNNGQPTIIETGSRLEIYVPKWSTTLNFSYVWLRDHCRCDKCYNGKTFQRLQDICFLPLNICPLSIDTQDETIQIKWSDKHISNYDYKFLWESSFRERTQRNSLKSSLWTRMTFPGIERISIPLKDFKNSEKGQKYLMNSILKYGVGIVSEVPPDVDSTESTVESLCAIKDTFYGKMWSFQADLEHADMAYSTEFLGAHTDTTYFTPPARIQVFHCLLAANGGETLLVDGFNTAQQYRELQPQGYKFLSETPTPAEFKGDGQHYVSIDTIFKHCPVSQNLYQIRFNMNDRAPLSTIPYEKVDSYYNYLHSLNLIVQKQANEVWLKLNPGQVLFIDNWRVMHGRAHYYGPRIMGGCYIDQDNFASKARVLGFCV